MARRAITREFYQSLEQAFTSTPGNCHAAARSAGCDWRTARRGWELGWPRYDWALPLREVVGETLVLTRARLLDESRAADDARKDLVKASAKKAALDATDSRAQEALAVRAARGNAIALMGATSHLLRGVNQLAQKVDRKLAEGDFSPKTASALLRDIANTVRQGNEAAKIAIQMEHLLLGKPTDIVGVVVIESEEDAHREIALAQEALERAKLRAGTTAVH